MDKKFLAMLSEYFPIKWEITQRDDSGRPIAAVGRSANLMFTIVVRNTPNQEFPEMENWCGAIKNNQLVKTLVESEQVLGVSLHDALSQLRSGWDKLIVEMQSLSEKED